jgi:hypothetical protein
MGTERLDPVQVAALFRRDEDPDTYYDITAMPHTLPPLDALRHTLWLCERAPDESALTWIGTVLIEPLVDLHWRAVGDRLIAAAEKSRPVRVALAGAWFHLPRRAREIEHRLDELAKRPSATND